MNLILKVIAKRDQLLRAAAYNAAKILHDNVNQPRHTQAGHEKLITHYHEIMAASHDIVKLVAATVMLNGQVFRSNVYADEKKDAKENESSVTVYNISGEYIVALGMFREILNDYRHSLEQLASQPCISYFDNVDLLSQYVNDLQNANFTPAVILQACENSRALCKNRTTFQIEDTKALFQLHDSFSIFIAYSSGSSDREKCDALTYFFQVHHPLTTMVDHIERQCRRLNATTSWCILWNQPLLQMNHHQVVSQIWKPSV